MKAFMDESFILETETAKHLYEAYAKDLPIIDYHCHISPKEVCEDRRFDNLAQVWLGGKNPDGSYFGDHYKWRIMRSAGIPEELVTGDTDGADRIEAFASALELAIGNPMVHWCNLELKRFFGINEPLTRRNARAIYEECSRKLREDPNMSVRGLIKQSKVAYVGTTDDPTDNLEWHAKFQAEEDPGFKMCPSFRPDKALNIHKAGFAEYISKLAAVVGKEELTCAKDVCDTLVARIEYFKTFGCRASDHGIDYIPYRESTQEEVDAIFRKGMAGETLTVEEIEKYQTVVLLALGEAYHRYNIVMEIHYASTGYQSSTLYRCYAGLRCAIRSYD